MPKHFSRQNSNSRHSQQCVLNDRTGRLECVFVNLEAVYPEAGNLSAEFCFEELRAKHRGLLNNDWRKTKIATMVKRARNDPFEDLQDEPAQQESSIDELQVQPPQQPVKSKDRGFKIFEDTPLESLETRPKSQEKPMTLALNDENDENTPPTRQEVDLAKKARREERANRTRKIKVMDVKHIKNETKTIQLNMDSPTGPKIKKRKSIAPEPTMTINTKEAMDEIYGIFSQPLQQAPSEPTDGEEDEDESSADETDYTTGDESTATGKLSAAASEYGDETRNELMAAHQSEAIEEGDNTGWSDFTTSKHVPKDNDESVDPSTQSTIHDNVAEGEEDIVTPINEEDPRTRYVPLPPEDYDPPVSQMRDMSIIPNHRLPFMTPIVERTESSLGVATARTEKDYFGAKTPSRKLGMPEEFDDDDDEPCSSPFQDVLADMEEDKRRVLQPIRTKSTKGTIALGQGTAKSQTEARKEEPEPAAQKGPIIQDEQCNPMDPYLRQTILSQMRPSLSSFEGYHEDLERSCGRSAEIKKYVRTLSKASRNSVNVDKTAQTLSAPPVIDLPGAQGTYIVKRELGAGTFAPVYLIENSAAAAIEEEGDGNAPASRVGKTAHRKALEAIKMEEPASTWEFYILRQSHRRLGVSRAAESIIRAHEMHLYRDECYLVEEFRDQGTLLDLVNLARLDSGNGGGMDEMMAIWLTVELLRVTEAMHAKQLIHGDLKGDNVLVRFDDPGMETDWSPTYFPSGAHGWSSKGVCLIDFGRGIDMRHFRPDVAFIADWKTSEADCAEMRELRPWTYQIDYHGLAGIVHSLLFGKYMETVGEKGASLGQGATKTYRIRENFKRYWQTEMWSDVFTLLLNPLTRVEAEEGKKMPVLRGMRQCRERMESWLEENCERGVGLKGMISRMEGAIRERKRKSAKSSQ